MCECEICALVVWLYGSKSLRISLNNGYHVDALRKKAKDKYDNDPVFRKRKLALMKERRDRVKLEKLAQQ